MQRRPELSVVHNHSLCHPERSGIIRLRMIHEVEGPMHLYLRAQARGVAIQACLWLEWESFFARRRLLNSSNRQAIGISMNPAPEERSAGAPHRKLNHAPAGRSHSWHYGGVAVQTPLA